jgi:hypothetical protein
MRKPKKKKTPEVVVNPELIMPVKVKGLQAEGVAAKAAGVVAWLVGRAARKYAEAAAEGIGIKVNKKTKKKKKLKEESVDAISAVKKQPATSGLGIKKKKSKKQPLSIDELYGKGSIDTIGKYHAARSSKGAPNSLHHAINRNRAARLRDIHKGTGPLGKTTMKNRMQYATNDSKQAKKLKSMSEAMGFKPMNPQKKIEDMTPDEHLKHIKQHADGARKFGKTLLGQMHGRHAGRHLHHFLNKDKSREGALKAMAALKEDYDYYMSMIGQTEQTFEEGWGKSKTGGYTAFASDMKAHKGPIRCPKCRSEIHLGIAKPHRDRDNDVTHHTATCHKCKAGLTIFNDGWEPEAELTELSKRTLGSYIKKAHVSGTGAAAEAEEAHQNKNYSQMRWAHKTSEKREQGIKKAVRKLTKEETISEAHKVGDIVKPKTGPHKGVDHKVIHVHDDGSYNIKPDRLPASRIKYRLGAVRATHDQLQEDIIKKPRVRWFNQQAGSAAHKQAVKRRHPVQEETLDEISKRKAILYAVKAGEEKQSTGKKLLQRMKGVKLADKKLYGQAKVQAK